MNNCRSFGSESLYNIALKKGLLDAAVARLAARPEFASHRRPDAAARKWLRAALVDAANEAIPENPWEHPEAFVFDDAVFDAEQAALLAKLINDCVARTRLYHGWMQLGADLVDGALRIKWSPPKW